MGNEQVFFQIKDFEEISIDDLEVSHQSINIKGKPHRLAPGKNAIFFKQINLETDSEILGFRSKLFNGIHIVSMNRSEIDQAIEDLYETDPWRKNIISQFLNKKLDKREFVIQRKDLPLVSHYSTQLSEPTVIVSRSILRDEKVLLIEGKPGVGKSHLVNLLTKTTANFILYRFWISNQDPHKQDRLIFENFIVDLSKRLFTDFVNRSEDDIISEISNRNATFILDGLDHVENYNNTDLERFVRFIDRIKERTRAIILSRPLRQRPNWKRQLLENWNLEQTKQVLEELYHIEYEIADSIYKITLGYPILVKYISEHYKKYGTIPDTKRFEDINSYYDQIVSQEKGKQALALFLCTSSFLMHSEVSLLLGKETSPLITEFISERPYLFDLRLNRITLFHDSFHTYLRNSAIDYSTMAERISEQVYQSIMAGEKRFQSRLLNFEFSIDQCRSIVQKFASLDYFKIQIGNVTDYEAFRDLYTNIRQLLCKLEPKDLSIEQYYDLGLILSLTVRDHGSSINGFYYIYARALLMNGVNEEHITSSRYLFGMLYYLNTGDGTHMENLKSNSYFETSEFFRELKNDISKENDYFSHYHRPLSPKTIIDALSNTELASNRDNLVYILADLYVNRQDDQQCVSLLETIENYMEGKEDRAVEELTEITATTAFKHHRATHVLSDAKRRLLAIGKCSETNDFINLSLGDLIKNGRSKGDYELWTEVVDYLRLSIYQNRKIDIESISGFWTKYDKRHDYTFLKSPGALIPFEELGYLDWKDSVSFLIEIQGISEKGYRWLVGSYIEQKGVEFLEPLLNEFDHTQLRTSWLLLPPEFLNVLPMEVFDAELDEQMYYHRSSRTIEVHDIINALKSEKAWLVKRELKLAGFKIKIDTEHPEIEFVRSTGINIQIHEREQYDDDILNVEQSNEPLKTIIDVAKETDDYYWALPKPEKFHCFDQADIRKNINQIFFHGLTAKTKNSEAFHSAFFLSGNMVKILHDAKVKVDYGRLFKSFCAFIDLSHFQLQ
ncbi:hypothetical protein [Pedobacter sp.]